MRRTRAGCATAIASATDVPHEWPTIATSIDAELVEHGQPAGLRGRRVVALGPARPAEALEVDRDDAVCVVAIAAATVAQLSSDAP